MMTCRINSAPDYTAWFHATLGSFLVSVKWLFVDDGLFSVDVERFTDDVDSFSVDVARFTDDVFVKHFLKNKPFRQSPGERVLFKLCLTVLAAFYLPLYHHINDKLHNDFAQLPAMLVF